MASVSVCFVCLGNICRSPTAAGVMRHRLAEVGLDHLVEVDSAGTAGYHIGQLPDDRARAEARARGIDIDDLGRKFGARDFDRFDLVLAMDDENLDDLRRLAHTDEQRSKIRLLREFDADAPPGASVPDPYYGGDDGFAEVYDLVDAACLGLIEHLRREHGLGVTEQLRAALTTALGIGVTELRPVGGGCINDAYRAELADGTVVFAKSHRSPPTHFFEVEAAALRWLDDAGGVNVPEVRAWSDEDPPFLALQWLEPGPPSPSTEEVLGQGMAQLHQAGAPTFGWDRGGYVGDLPQDNEPADPWADFYRARRLAPLARAAIDAGHLPRASSADFERLFDRLAELVGPEEPPARLHGDLWAGNLLITTNGEPWVVDPAPYGGHREVDLAMMRLFGGFGPRFFAAYSDSFALAEGQEERVGLYQLYPLLVHVNLFGPMYASRTLAVVARYT